MGGYWPRMLPWHFPGSGERALPRGCALWNRPECSELLLTLPALGWGLGEGRAGGGGQVSPRTHQISQLGILRPVTGSMLRAAPGRRAGRPWQPEVQGRQQVHEVLAHCRRRQVQPTTPHPSGGPRDGKPGSAHILQGRVQTIRRFLWALNILWPYFLIHKKDMIVSTPEDGSQVLKIKSSWLLSYIYQRRLYFISAIQQPRGK